LLGAAAVLLAKRDQQQEKGGKEQEQEQKIPTMKEQQQIGPREQSALSLVALFSFWPSNFAVNCGTLKATRLRSKWSLTGPLGCKLNAKRGRLVSLVGDSQRERARWAEGGQRARRLESAGRERLLNSIQSGKDKEGPFCVYVISSGKKPIEEELS